MSRQSGTASIEASKIWFGGKTALVELVKYLMRLQLVVVDNRHLRPSSVLSSDTQCCEFVACFDQDNEE
jgi:hypothetical protein